MFQRVAVLFTIYIHSNSHANGRKAQPRDQLNTRFFVLVFWGLLGRTDMRTRERKERQSTQTVCLFLEMIEQELRPVDCEQGQTDF